jgi:hypothetical protein
MVVKNNTWLIVQAVLTDVEARQEDNCIDHCQPHINKLVPKGNKLYSNSTNKQGKSEAMTYHKFTYLELHSALR